MRVDYAKLPRALACGIWAHQTAEGSGPEVTACSCALAYVAGRRFIAEALLGNDCDMAQASWSGHWLMREFSLSAFMNSWTCAKVHGS